MDLYYTTFLWNHIAVLYKAQTLFVVEFIFLNIRLNNLNIYTNSFIQPQNLQRIIKIIVQLNHTALR